MGSRDSSAKTSLKLKAGEWIEVRSRDEILATLNEQGRLDNLPFMPEMLQYCGQRLRVFKRADKTCDNIKEWSIRRMKDSVHLEGVRCDGSRHGGCEAGCLIFWKEAWLKRAESRLVPPESLRGTGVVPTGSRFCTVESILAASQSRKAEGESVYFCQATELRNFTSHMRAWNPGQYIRDLRSGNLDSGLAGDFKGQRALDVVLAITRLGRALIITLFNTIQEKRHALPYPHIIGTLDKTPIEALDLQPGELVQVRSKEEIFATLDARHRNRGLLFDSEMLPYCGGIFRVLRRVHQIVDEKTGKMMHMKYPCIVLEGVVCQSDFHRFCPRAIYSYWREGWLRRASAETVSEAEQYPTVTCQQC